MFLPLLATLLASGTASALALGLSLQDGRKDLPLLTLPYATYRGTVDEVAGTVTFRNIRFAAPPLGALRWAKPAPPLQESEVQNGTLGHSCVGNRALLRMPALGQSEDCLFLDVTVPAKVLADKSAKVPIVVWIYGGAYVMGSKEQGDSPKQMIKAAKGNLIWVAGNYRLGAWGFLNGPTVEKEGVPNAGFHDQRAVFEWVNKYSHLFGGNTDAVTAMGISAGAGSIIHHMVAEGGTLDPLFTRAILQSPGYQTMQDRPGFVEGKFKLLESELGCTGKGLKCMREADVEKLKIASDKVSATVPLGKYPFLPTPDTKYIRQTPAMEFSAGRYWKNITGIINSHVKNEGAMFVGPDVKDEASLETFVTGSFGRRESLDSLAKKAISMYPSRGETDTFFVRAARFVTETSFTCHSRAITNAYPSNLYSVVYEVPPSTHGSDQSGTFISTENKTGYQSLLVSFAVTGNPNSLRDQKRTIEWPKTTGFDDLELSNVLLVKSLGTEHDMELGKDPLQNKERCGFWQQSRQAIQKAIDM